MDGWIRRNNEDEETLNRRKKLTPRQRKIHRKFYCTFYLQASGGGPLRLGLRSSRKRASSGGGGEADLSRPPPPSPPPPRFPSLPRVGCTLSLSRLERRLGGSPSGEKGRP